MKAIVFSRDRAMQLDLLLTSLNVNAPGLFETSVIWNATRDEFRKTYKTCEMEHRDVRFLREDGLTYQVRSIIQRARGLVSFFTDDDVLFRKVGQVPVLEDEFICLSLRLGRNTTFCYPHGRTQELPDGILWGEWEWAKADGDFGYPMSLDGHIFRASDLDMFLGLRHFSTPNFLEEVLMASAQESVVNGVPFRKLRPLMTSYRESRLVGIPVNRVQTKNPNRHGETHPYSVQELNDRYLAGERISLEDLDFSDIRGAHQELELKFR